MIQAIVCSSVPMSGAMMSRSGPMIGMISLVYRRVTRSSSVVLYSERVDRDAALGAAVGHVDDGALPRHPHRQRAHLVDVDARGVAQAALAGAAGDVVLHAVAA